MILAEPGVALTDFALALETGTFAVILDRTRSTQRRFVLFFAATAAAALLGGAVHGFFPDPAGSMARLLWRLTLLAVGIAAFGAWAAGARLGLPERVARWLIRVAAVELVAYGALVLTGERRFAVAICQYLPAAAFLLVVLAARWIRRRERAALGGACALALTFAASGLQQAGIGLHPRWFNHNALYHLLQGIALALLFWCARTVDRTVGC
jgi:hypothetical protein